MLKDRNNVSVADSINEALVLSMKKNKKRATDWTGCR